MKKFIRVCMAIIVLGLLSFNAQAEESSMKGKILVAYFSATKTTEGVAQKLAAVTGADLFEIEPEQLYTDADLDWRNDQSRSSIEMNDRSSRPAIASKVEDMGKYDVVFIGFPIWWGREPSIIDTFIETYDFSNKTIVPFVTSGSSDIGDTGKIMQSLVPKAKVLEGKRFPGNVSEDELKEWAAEWL